MNFWLMKSEPDVFSIDDLKQRPTQTDSWNGVRNYQARNMLRDQIKLDDLVFFYHSNCKEPGIVGIMKIVKEGYIDETAFDSKQDYYDPKATFDNPRWYTVDVKFQKKFSRTITRRELRDTPMLMNMLLLKKGNRLSVMPISATEWQTIINME